MSELKGLWCFYIGQGGRQWPKGASADPHWHTHTQTHTHTHSLSHSQPSVLAPFLTHRYAWENICMHINMHFLSLTNSHCYAWTHTHTPGPCCPIPTPLWSFWLLFVSPVCRVTRTFLSRPLSSVHPAGTDWDPTQPSTPDTHQTQQHTNVS